MAPHPDAARDRRRTSRRITALCTALITVAGGAVLAGAPVLPARALAASPWVRDFHYDFDVPQNDQLWGRYGWGVQPVGNGAMGTYSPDNVYTHDGVLALRTHYVDGGWTSAGVSGDPGYAVAGGKWEVRAKMPVATGIGYCFLLYPDDHSWPPEIDIAEGRVNGPIDSTYHWGAENNRATTRSVTDTHQWHTYGVILGNNQIIFTIDGDNVTGVINNVPVTTKKLWIGFQTGAMDPNGSAKAYETVPGGVPNPLTPASSEVQIMWVAHYHH